jgi:hypothetical protein
MKAFVIAASVALLASAAAPAGAQDENPTTPGAIPDPGSYQGSMQLQQQERQQDEQTGRQYAPAPSYGGNGGGNYGGGGYRGRGGGGGSSYGRNGGYGIPDTSCYNEVANIPELAPLQDRVSIGPVDPRRTEILFIRSKPTPDERALLRKWLAARHYCRTLISASVGAQTPMFHHADLNWGALATERLIERLISGELTYGEFNRQRALNGQMASRYWAAH